MELIEVRRLTGPNLLMDVAGAVMDVATDDPMDDALRLGSRIGAYLDALGWPCDLHARPWVGGVTVAFPADVDILYAACEILEQVMDEVAAGTVTEPISTEAVARIQASADDERDPVLRAMLDAAAAHDVAGVWDDDELSIGLGAGSITWTRDAVPSPDDVDWSQVHDVPAALVTGTNGKSTTVRMLATILRAAGRRPGNSSTDGIVVDGELVEAGDWSGPGGGRTVARDTRVGTMVLECARGGLLRRGLPVERAQVSVVTNVAEDHLGEYGIESVEDLAQAKLVVAKAVEDAGILIVNAEDPLLVRGAPHGERTWWFSRDPSLELLAMSVAGGGTVLTIEDGWVVRRTAAGDTRIVEVVAMPSTMAGAATHNVANALAAAGAALALGVEPETVGAALASFVADAEANPGRANRYDVDGVQVVIDFAHNVHGVIAMTELLSALPAQRRLVLFSQAGDRPDDALDGLGRAVATSGADRYLVAEVPGYLRGREPMEVPRRLADGLVAAGADRASITEVADAIVGTEQALAWAQPGDALLLLVLEHRSEVSAMLAERGATPL